MATYAIGDVQGCKRTLKRLLTRIEFDSDRDRLWLVGDLVNRGPRSLGVLRWAAALDPARHVCVLGNHDLHLLAVASGVRKTKRKDTLEPILDARDRDELLEWLRHRPLLHREDGYVLVHAGLLPSWSVDEAEALARQAEEHLRGSKWKKFIKEIYRGYSMGGPTEVHDAVDVLTCMRACSPDGEPEFTYKGTLDGMPPGLVPWFDVPQRRSETATIVFGHWSALGLTLRPNHISTDTGCVWGNALTAVRLEDRQVFQEPAAG